MPAKEPSWWYSDTPKLTAKALTPAARIWGRVARRRYIKAAAYRAPVPVVCIGNFTAGGTGKTPLALLVAEELERLGRRPAFLSRGYGGRIAGPHWVMPGQDEAREVGDEPLLLARGAPTLIARDRATGARAIVATGAGHGAIVMDDGLQNGSVAKDLVLAVVDGRRGIGNGLVMPAGPLRAPLDFQLNLADGIVVNTPAGAKARSHDFVDWLRTRFDGPVMTASTEPAGETAWLQGTRVLAFSGIGAPERFFGLLERLGAQISMRRAFADHHAFTETEAKRLAEDAQRLGATLVTTEKDFVRLADAGYSGALKRQTRTLPIRLYLAERDRLRLSGLIEASLAAATGSGAVRR